MDKRFLITLSAAIIIFVGIFWASSAKNKTPISNSSSAAAASQHITGDTKSKVNVTEYGDYQCPYCGQYYPLVKQVIQKYSATVAFQFRNFPLVHLHPNAMVAARTAEAASLQGKFWQMHDLLYENQTTWAGASSPSPYFDQYAQQLGLNMNKFHQDQNSSAVLNTINADVASAQALKIDATPTFVINGKKIENTPTTVDGFSKLIDAALAAQK